MVGVDDLNEDILMKFSIDSHLKEHDMKISIRITF